MTQQGLEYLCNQFVLAYYASDWDAVERTSVAIVEASGKKVFSQRELRRALAESSKKSTPAAETKPRRGSR